MTPHFIITRTDLVIMRRVFIIMTSGSQIGDDGTVAINLLLLLLVWETGKYWCILKMRMVLILVCKHCADILSRWGFSCGEPSLTCWMSLSLLQDVSWIDFHVITRSCPQNSEWMFTVHSLCMCCSSVRSSGRVLSPCLWIHFEVLSGAVSISSHP